MPLSSCVISADPTAERMRRSCAARSYSWTQVGGTIIVDRTGSIVFIHRSQRISDNSRPADLVAALASGNHVTHCAGEPE